MLPPRVLTYADTEGSPLVFVDAQAVTTPVPPPRATAKEEEEMASFLPMLQEYLSMGGAEAKDATIPPPIVEEYVYDLYYRDIRDESATIPIGVGDGVTPMTTRFRGLFTPINPSDSEPEDEADEDSNEEDYYRNDYPEDEDADEDMQDFEDAYSDGEWSRSEEDGSEGGGAWDYR
ncbi:hypothetical protein EHS25_010039 [Saitozyma podzolica]|uniref:Probable RNA polymerase II nuclear localization protein SLC7A6OS n=1 Tax=Saitozyma podzolica TaxID=1890683 RepID=A0A427YIG7_9TREE|nr:hypothetical protein EHS25_010039 [Saitozyma podzolica]